VHYDWTVYNCYYHQVRLFIITLLIITRYAYFNIALPDTIVGSEMSPRTTGVD